MAALKWCRHHPSASDSTDYLNQEKPRPGWIARRLGISRAEESRCLETVAAAHQIRKNGAHWVVDQTQNVDTRTDPARGRKLKAERLKVALSRLESGAPGTFGYNLMAISRADLARLKEMHLNYFREMQALVTDSSPSECVVLFNTELLALDAPSA